MVSGTTTLISKNGQGTNSGNGASNLAKISQDGRYVFFLSGGSNFGPADINGTIDIYRRRGLSPKAQR